jgi:hypothetical protein
MKSASVVSAVLISSSAESCASAAVLISYLSPDCS